MMMMNMIAMMTMIIVMMMKVIHEDHDYDILLLFSTLLQQSHPMIITQTSHCFVLTHRPT